MLKTYSTVSWDTMPQDNHAVVLWKSINICQFLSLSGLSYHQIWKWLFSILFLAELSNTLTSDTMNLLNFLFIWEIKQAYIFPGNYESIVVRFINSSSMFLQFLIELHFAQRGNCNLRFENTHCEAGVFVTGYFVKPCSISLTFTRWIKLIFDTKLPEFTEFKINLT